MKQRNKYLDEIGMDIDDYGTNFVKGDRKSRKHWRKQRKECGFDSRECYDVERSFAEWLYSHLSMYLEDASQKVDLCDCTREIKLNGEVYSVESAIEYIITKLGTALRLDNMYGQDYRDLIHDAILMWAEVCSYTWW